MTEDPYVAAVKAATKQYEKARKAVEQAIFDGYRAPGVKRTAIAAASPWTAAHVRKLVREEGIEPDPAYKERAETIRRRAGEAEVPNVDTIPAWLRHFPAIAALSHDEARDRAGQLELDRPEWFRENRKDCLAEPPWVNHAMLAADASDPAETVTANPGRSTVD